MTNLSTYDQHAAGSARCAAVIGLISADHPQLWTRDRIITRCAETLREERGYSWEAACIRGAPWPTPIYFRSTSVGHAMTFDNPALRTLRANVSGRVLSGEAEPIIEQKEQPMNDLTEKPIVHDITRRIGIAGQFSVTATVEYPGEQLRALEFVGSVYGGPVVMRTENGLEVFVTDPGRFGDLRINGVGWVRRFMEAS